MILTTMILTTMLTTTLTTMMTTMMMMSTMMTATMITTMMITVMVKTTTILQVHRRKVPKENFHLNHLVLHQDYLTVVVVFCHQLQHKL